jgi:3-dehydroquinate synthase
MKPAIHPAMNIGGRMILFHNSPFREKSDSLESSREKRPDLKGFSGFSKKGAGGRKTQIATKTCERRLRHYCSAMRVVKVGLDERTYSIRIGQGVLEQLGRECRMLMLGARCAIITDKNVAPLYAQAARRSLEESAFSPLLITVPAGETAKSLDVVQSCYDRLAAHRLDRKSFIVALGGGVVGDMGGFVAATYLRGIAFVQAPTTLLAQVDSSVGGKTGVNLKAGKNLVGAFHQPRLVLCDLNTLQTLPEREYRAGLAEVIKYGIIFDQKLFQRLERILPKLLKRDSDLLTSIVARCCEIKAQVVSQDETERGLRAILNFGHTVGHAIEAVSGYGKYLHGEAISMGQVAAARLSAAVLGLRSKDVERISRLLGRAGLPVKLNFNPAQREQLLTAMQLDKKVSGGEVKFVLAEKIGKVVWGQKVAPALLAQALKNGSRPEPRGRKAAGGR